MMDEQARQAEAVSQQTGRIRVMVHDNTPVHTSQQVRQKWTQWQSKGLYVFFLPKYCSELNPIETEWRQLKTHQLVGQMFEDELDLAYALINRLEARAQAGDCQAERFRFPSQLTSSHCFT